MYNILPAVAGKFRGVDRNMSPKCVLNIIIIITIVIIIIYTTATASPCLPKWHTRNVCAGSTGYLLCVSEWRGGCG